MKSVYVRNLCKGFLKKKKVNITAWIVIVILFAGVGYVKVSTGTVSDSSEEALQQYEAMLQKYEEAIQEVQNNIELSQEQVDKQQKYCDESVYMQLDPSSVPKANVQYALSISDMSSEDSQQEQASVLKALADYVNDIDMSTAELDGDIAKEYLQELISVDRADGVLSITVMGTDIEQAKRIREIIEKQVESYAEDLHDDFGAFSLTRISTSEQTTADINVQNTQNSNLTNLRNYVSAVTDYKTKLVQQQTYKTNYIENYKPDTDSLSGMSAKKSMIVYGAFGIIAGVVLPFAVYALYYTISGRIKGKEELLAAKIPVLSVVSLKSDLTTAMAGAALNAKLLAQKEAANAVVLTVLGKSDSLGKTGDAAELALTNQGLTVLLVREESETDKDLQTVVETGKQILIVEAGTTTYAQIEDQMKFAERFGITVWGCIVIE